jgi:mannose-6-phosphate isomerase-like protein (cupin superfamily)
MKGYAGNIEEKTLENENYREVLYTGPDSQLVVMSIPPGVEIGEETHDLDQFVRIEKGAGEAILDGEVHEVRDGFAVVVPSGTSHNIKNTGGEPLKLYTIYTAPEHPEGTIHKTKEDSIKDEGH